MSNSWVKALKTVAMNWWMAKLVFSLDAEGKYQLTRFQNDELIISPTFPQLQLTATQIISA
ncbi:hypothetical protein [Synechococcus sp. PCC 7502]|uniref:hypothetical protein n=1 Tax=Synechococcus sp. PCC 7502 TaxID=1173263 RepID=UPI0011817F3B|nr:hypothetical protein [Synechococcus sp. PCC 7502]